MSKKQYELSQEDQFFHDMFLKHKNDPVDSGAWDTGTNYAPVKKCAHSHPPLKFVVKDVEYKIYGGACGSPIVHDADIYVGLDVYSMVFHGSNAPWRGEVSKILDIQYAITDMSPPSNADDFKLMIDWLCNQLQEGKKIHVGCIGGHGRTGLVLAAVYAHMTGEKDAIQYVRKHYCSKVVESDSQVKFLMKHFGVTKVEGTKSHGVFSAPAFQDWGKKMKGSHNLTQSGSKGKLASFSNAKKKFENVKSTRNIW